MLRQFTRLCVRYAEEYIPDPYIYAAAMTFVSVAAALVWTSSSLTIVLGAWYGGLWSILGFSMQMALVLLTGVTLAEAPPVKGLLARLAAIPKGQAGAVTMVFFISALGSWMNWGFGLVIGTVFAREIAKRLPRLDFPFVVAAAYAGFIAWASGPSSSIALATATHGSALNIVEQITGKTVGFDGTIFAAFNWVPVLIFVLVYPFILLRMAPPDAEMKTIDPATLVDNAPAEAPTGGRKTFAVVLERSPIITILLVGMAALYCRQKVGSEGFSLDFNVIICGMLVLGLICHWRPINYVRAFNRAAGNVGPIILQYPLYGGIMGIMTVTGLAGVIAKGFVAFSTHATLPFWSFIASNIITLFVPSGGGHWAVQGPFMVPAAVALNVDPAMTAMAVAMGEATGNMIQPFWALPLLALARLGIRDIMGYCVIALLAGLAIFGGSLLVFAAMA